MPGALTRSGIEAEHEAAAKLEHIWETEPGLMGWLGTVDHKLIGRRYLVTAFAFLVVGGIEAAVMRFQLAQADLGLIGPERYNQLFTLHGMTMIFWYASPILSGFGNYLIPMVIGARDMAYPRLNAFTYWTFLFSGLLLYGGSAFGQTPSAGWFAYAPLTELQYSPGYGMDFYAVSLIFLTVSTTAGAINFIATIARHRAAYMTLSRAPLLSYSTFTVSGAVVFSLPPLTVACVFLLLDRRFNFHFFTPERGGDPVLWQHLFWFFGHPWVYVIFLPATGMISMLLPTFARRPIVGYPFVAASTVLTGIVGFGVWVHHMFAVGMSQLSMSFFSAASMSISVFSTVQVFAWIATLWKGRPVMTTSMLFAVGFIAALIIGGLSGVATAIVPLDWQLTDTYFVVGHLHYVLVGANVFPVFAGFYYWLPKIIGRKLDESLGKWSFWLMFIGFNVVFFPMHIAGAMGMPRRIATYGIERGWQGLNLIESVGVLLLTVGILASLYNLWVSYRRGEPAGKDPWNAGTLEWSSESPPPSYGTVHLPTVRSRYPLWDAHDDEHDPEGARILDQGRFSPTTSFTEGKPIALARMPHDTVTPFLAGLGLTALSAGAVLQLGWLTAAGAVGAIAAGFAWLWPESGPLPPVPPGEVIDEKRGSLGMWLFIATEATLFAMLFFSWTWLGPWPAEKPEKLTMPFVMLALLTASSVTLYVADHLEKKGQLLGARLGTLATFGLGGVFIALQAAEYAKKAHELTPQMGSYASMFYAITGFHGLHVIGGLLMLAYVALLPRPKDRPPHRSLTNVGWYWHFIGLVWVLIVLIVYVAPHAQRAA